MKVREHDFAGGKGCRHCGTTGPGSTCIEREVDVVADTGPRVMAVDDFDTIGKRLAELRAQKGAAMALSQDDLLLWAS